MNILIDINHPAHVHLLRNAYKELVKRGHKVIVTVKDIPSAKQLLDLYEIPYIEIGKKDDKLALKGLDQLIYNWRILRLVRKHHIELGIGSSINIAHVSKLSRMHSIILDDDDDEVEPLFAKYAHPFADVVLSPKETPRATKKVVYYPAYHELAYLHPGASSQRNGKSGLRLGGHGFTPSPDVLDEAGIAYKKDASGKVTEVEPYFIMRFNAFKAHHDVGVVGLTIENKRRMLELLSRHGKVFITTERNIDAEFAPYQLRVSPEKAHSLMYYATLFVGDSQTMTSEAAVLGTPSIRCNTFVGRIHYLEEEEHRYGLTYGFRPEASEAMFSRVEELLAMGTAELKKEWEKRRAVLLGEKIDYTAFLVWFVENYPQSVEETKNANEEFWKRFK